MVITKEDAHTILSFAWRGIEAEREWNQGVDKGKHSMLLGPDWAVSKTREFEANRNRYYEIRNKWFPKPVKK